MKKKTPVVRQVWKMEAEVRNMAIDHVDYRVGQDMHCTVGVIVNFKDPDKILSASGGSFWMPIHPKAQTDRCEAAILGASMICLGWMLGCGYNLIIKDQIVRVRMHREVWIGLPSEKPTGEYAEANHEKWHIDGIGHILQERWVMKKEFPQKVNSNGFHLGL